MVHNERRRHFLQRIARLSGILVICLTFVTGCSVAQVFKSDKGVEEPDIGLSQELNYVEVSRIIKSQISDLPGVSADLTPSVSLDVTVKTAGIVVQVLKKRGDTVQAGDILIKLSSADAQYQREKAYIALTTVQNALLLANTNKKNELAKAERELSEQSKSFNRTRNDYDEGLASLAQVEEAEVRLTMAKASVDRLKLSSGSSDLEAQLRSAQISLKQADDSLAALEVKAPISGILTSFSATPGVTLSGNAKVGVIQKVDPIKITAYITDQNTKIVKDKKELNFYVPGTTINGVGEISYFSSVADPVTRLYELSLEVPNKDLALKPGLNVQVQLENEQNLMVVTVPTYSIIREGTNAFVYVLVNDVVEKRTIQLGRTNEPIQEVISGVEEGEMIVISGQHALKDGEKVQLASVQADKK